MAQYAWKPGAHAPTGLQADAVAEHLAVLRAQYGELTPEVILNDAESPQSPIHTCFEWADTEAARQYRLSQARQLVRVIIRVPENADERPVRAYVSINDGMRRSYEPIEVALTDVDMRREVLVKALRELNQLRRKYADLQELATVWAAVPALGNIT